MSFSLPPYFTFVFLHLCHCVCVCGVCVCACVVGADRGAVSRCLCQRIQKDAEEETSCTESPFLSRSGAFALLHPFFIMQMLFSLLYALQLD